MSLNSDLIIRRGAKVRLSTEALVCGNDMSSRVFDSALSVGSRRRDFLRNVAGLGAAATWFSVSSPLRALAGASKRPKVVVVTFGGGARDDETFAIEGQRNIPHLLNELLPQGTFFTQVVNRGILGHYVATASIATGAYETFNNFVPQPPATPTMFEYYRKQLARPSQDCWIIAPSNGFQRIGASANSLYGPNFGAGVILPKYLLASAVTGHAQTEISDYGHLLRDSYESPAHSLSISEKDSELNLTQLATTFKLSVSDFVQHARNLTSPDELSVYIARRLMNQMAPTLLFLTLHDIDVAHSGAYSLYLDGIQRADRLCAELWQTIQSHPEYKDSTTLIILPDFGRDGDQDAGGNGFQHHRTGSAIARTTWLLALGPGIRHNAVVNTPIESVDVVPSVGGILSFDTPLSHGRRISELI